MNCLDRRDLRPSLNKNITNFSIENILTPQFGRKLKGDIGFVESLILIFPTLATPAVVREKKNPTVIPAWVFCTRYSDRPSSGILYKL